MRNQLERANGGERPSDALPRIGPAELTGSCPRESHLGKPIPGGDDSGEVPHMRQHNPCEEWIIRHICPLYQILTNDPGCATIQICIIRHLCPLYHILTNDPDCGTIQICISPRLCRWSPSVLAPPCDPSRERYANPGPIDLIKLPPTREQKRGRCATLR